MCIMALKIIQYPRNVKTYEKNQMMNKDFLDFRMIQIYQSSSSNGYTVCLQHKKSFFTSLSSLC